MESVTVQVELSRGKKIPYEVPYLQVTPETFLRKSIILFGESHTGKTVFLKHILYQIAEFVPNIVVFSASEKENKSLDGIVPKAWIHYEWNADVLDKLYERQKMAAIIYNTANHMETLIKLFNLVADENAKFILKEMTNVKQIELSKLNSSLLPPADKKNKEIQLNKIYNKTYIKILKFYIRKYKRRLDAQNFSPDSPEGIALKYLYFNPHMVVIFEDMGATLKKESKNTTLQELFFQGRHKYITSIYLFQEVTTVPPGLRKNAFIKIFCALECVLSYFNAKSNSVPKSTVKIIEKVAEKIFTKTAGYENYKKLIYLRDCDHKIQYCIADMHAKFEMGSPHTRELSDKGETEDTVDQDNDYYADFFT